MYYLYSDIILPLTQFQCKLKTFIPVRRTFSVSMSSSWQMELQMGVWVGASYMSVWNNVELNSCPCPLRSKGETSSSRGRASPCYPLDFLCCYLTPANVTINPPFWQKQVQHSLWFLLQRTFPFLPAAAFFWFHCCRTWPQYHNTQFAHQFTKT